MTTFQAQHPHSSRGGFTLVELIVVLAVSGMVVLIVHNLFGAAGEQSRTLAHDQWALTRRENATRWLGDAFASLQVGGGDDSSFVGEAEHVVFSTLLLTAYGWHELQRVELSMNHGQLLALLDDGQRVVLADSVASVAFEYLVERGEVAPWLSGWTSAASAPLAVRVRLERIAGSDLAGPVDTTIFLVGDRG